MSLSTLSSSHAATQKPRCRASCGRDEPSQRFLHQCRFLKKQSMLHHPRLVLSLCGDLLCRRFCPISAASQPPKPMYRTIIPDTTLILTPAVIVRAKASNRASFQVKNVIHRAVFVAPIRWSFSYNGPAGQKRHRCETSATGKKRH